MKGLFGKFGPRLYVASAATVTTVLALYALVAPYEEGH